MLDKKVKAVLFDWDDTLVRTIEVKWAEHKHVARTWYNREILDEDLRRHWGKPLHTLVELLYETDDIDGIIDRLLAVSKDFPKVLFEDTLGVIEHLRASGKFVGLVTAHSQRGIDDDFETLGIPETLFDYIQTADDTMFHKPDPKVFEPTIVWLAGHGISPKQTAYIGDGLQDMKAGLGVRFQFIGVETGLITGSEFRAAGASTIKSLQELLPR